MRLVLIGLVAGFFSALFGVGGGIVIVPLLLLVAALGPPPGDARPRSPRSASPRPPASSPTSSHGEVEPAYALLVGVPAAFGAAGGSVLQQRVPVRTLSFLFAGLLVAIAIRMLLQ